MTDMITDVGFDQEPWEVRRSGHNFDICLPPENGTAAVVATVFAGERVARLIAAAPELFEALDGLCSGIGSERWDRARASLRKARGEAE